MSSTGAGYDISPTIFSPDGRIYQVEYAAKAVENSGTAIGANCVDGAVVAVEKPLLSKMLVEGSGRRVHMIDDHIGGVMAGLVADGRQLVNRARQEAQAYRRNYAESIPPHILADRMSQFAHAYTCYDALRPFGASLIIIGYDERARKHEMYLIEPSGVGLRHFGCAVGKGRQAAKTEIEKAGVMGKTCREALTDLAKTLRVTHDETKDKPYELEMGWVCADTNWRFELVPRHIREAANAEAQRALEEAEQSESDED